MGADMNAWKLRPGDGIAGLRRGDAVMRSPGPTDVVVRVRAASLNYRDLMFARGDYLGIGDAPLIPLCDGAGEVVEVGRDVTRFKPGDRVINAYFPRWIDGSPAPWKVGGVAGAHVDGVLAERFVVEETGLVPIPPHLGYAEASTTSS